MDGGACVAILAETAFAGTIDLGTVGGVNYSGNSSSAPIVPNGVEIGPDAECASGTRLVGGGVEIGGDFAESQFTRSAPGDESLASGQSWVTVWANLAGSGKTASVTAACMDREVRRVRETKTVEAGGAAAVKVSCPAGTQVSGGGFIEADAFQSYLNSSYPIDGGDRGSRPDDGWKVRVRNSTAGSGKATVEARCVQFDPSYLVGGQFLIPPGVTITTDAACPTGAHVVGGGVRLGGAASEAHPVAMNLADDSTDANTVPDDSLHVVVGNAPSTDPKPIRMYAVCRT